MQTPFAILALAASPHPLIYGCCLRRWHRGDRSCARGHLGWNADLIRHWQATGQQQVISQAELAVVVAMRHMLKERLSGRRVIYFIDNEAAKFSLLKGTSGKESMQQLTAAFHAVD